jgi:hypothetical protein
MNRVLSIKSLSNFGAALIVAAAAFSTSAPVQHRGYYYGGGYRGAYSSGYRGELRRWPVWLLWPPLLLRLLLRVGRCSERLHAAV